MCCCIALSEYVSSIVHFHNIIRSIIARLLSMRNMLYNHCLELNLRLIHPSIDCGKLSP